MKIKLSKEIKAGIFAIIALFGIYWGINFLKGIQVFSSSNTIYATYDKSDNLEVSSPVLLRGISIGTVIATTLSEDNSNVIVTMSLDGGYNIPSDSKAIITNKSMLGGKAVVIEFGTSATSLKDGDSIAGVIDNNMQEQIDEVKNQLMSTVGELTQTLSSVNKVLNDTTVNNINESINSIRVLTKSAENIISGSSTRISSIVTDISDLTSSLSLEVPAIMGNIRSLTDTLTNIDIAEVIRSAQFTLAEINLSIEAINSKKGTIGKLLYDPEMYDNLNGAADSLKALFGNIKSEPGRYVHFSLFGRKDKSDKK